MNLNLLKYYINEHQDSVEALSIALEIHYNTLSLKLNGKSEFTQKEIKIIADRYKLSPDQVVKVFL